MSEKMPKLGDKFAVLSRGMGDHVDGPFYVTSVRGSLCSLSKENKPDPKATRTWRAWGSDDLHSTQKYSQQTAETHVSAMRLQRTRARLASAVLRHQRAQWADLSEDDFLALLKILDKEAPHAQEEKREAGAGDKEA